MLMLSDRWFTTQTSVAERTATATGSMPTGTDASCVRPTAPTLKTSSRSSGVLTAKRRVASADSASGRTWPLSNVTNDPAPAAVTVTSKARTPRADGFRRKGRMGITVRGYHTAACRHDGNPDEASSGGPEPSPFYRMTDAIAA